MLSTDLNTNAENKGLECTIAYNDNDEIRFPNHVFLYQLWSDHKKW